MYAWRMVSARRETLENVNGCPEQDEKQWQDCTGKNVEVGRCGQASEEV